MRDIRRLTENEISLIKMMAHDHPVYDVAIAMYDYALTGKVSQLGYTAQHFFLDLISETEFFFLESQYVFVNSVDYISSTWDSLLKELEEFADSDTDENWLIEQTINVNAVLRAAESILLDYSIEENIREGNKNLIDFLLKKYPNAISLKNELKRVVTQQQEQLLKDYISRMTSDDIPFYTDSYYDELCPDNPLNDYNVYPSWWHIAKDKKELFAKHIAQMLEEGVFSRNFNLPLNNRQAFISDLENFFSLNEGELQQLIDKGK